MTKKAIFRPRFWLIPSILADDERIEPFDEKVYAAVDWFHGMKDGECRASNNSLAELIRPHDPQPRSVQNSLNRLEECGYIRREYKDAARRNRERIVPLIELSVGGKVHESRVTKKEEKKEVSTEVNKQVAEVIKEFTKINVSAKGFYGRPPQRKACEELIEAFGFDRVVEVISKTLPRSNGMEYFPTITTPVQLLEKWSSLESAILKHRSKLSNKSKVIFSPQTA